MNEYDKTTSPPSPMATAIIGGMEVSMLLDTGADNSCVPEDLVQSIQDRTSEQTHYRPAICLDYENKMQFGRLVLLNIAIPELGIDVECPLLEIAGSEGIVGRDLLQFRRMLFDGPVKRWAVCPDDECSVLSHAR